VSGTFSRSTDELLIRAKEKVPDTFFGSAALNLVDIRAAAE